MTCAEPSPCIGVEELVEPDVVLPVFVIVEQFISVVDGSAPIVASDKDMLQAMLDLFCNMA